MSVTQRVTSIWVPFTNRQCGGSWLVRLDIFVILQTVDSLHLTTLQLLWKARPNWCVWPTAGNVFICSYPHGTQQELIWEAFNVLTFDFTNGDSDQTKNNFCSIKLTYLELTKSPLFGMNLLTSKCVMALTYSTSWKLCISNMNVIIQCLPISFWNVPIWDISHDNSPVDLPQHVGGFTPHTSHLLRLPLYFYNSQLIRQKAGHEVRAFCSMPLTIPDLTCSWIPAWELLPTCRTSSW